jgi:hypothetical protein
MFINKNSIYEGNMQEYQTPTCCRGTLYQLHLVNFPVFGYGAKLARMGSIVNEGSGPSISRVCNGDT